MNLIVLEILFHAFFIMDWLFNKNFICFLLYLLHLIIHKYYLLFIKYDPTVLYIHCITALPMV